MNKINCSVIIHTKNEEYQLQKCIDTLQWSNDIVIFDSYSTDKTEEIALENKCRFIQRPDFDKSKPFGGSEAYHRNWGLRNIIFKNDWLFIIDADERCTKSCLMNIENVVNKIKNPVAAYRIKRRDFFQNTHLYHTQLSPWFIRLIKPKYITYERAINSSTKINGLVKNIGGYIDHYPFKSGLSAWVERHNYYSSIEAEEFQKAKATKVDLQFLRTCFFESEFEIRRIAQKKLFYKLPFRPFIKFFLTYILRRGFLDGRAGFNYAILQFFYEFLIILKQKEKPKDIDKSNF